MRDSDSDTRPGKPGAGITFGDGAQQGGCSDPRRCSVEAAADRGCETLFEQLPIGALIVTSDERILDCNERFLTMLGATRDEVLGKVCSSLRPIDGAQDITTRDLPSSWEGPLSWPPDGRELWVSARSLPLGEQSDSRIVLLIDLSDLHERERHLERMAERDPLTGLVNRARFEGELRIALARAAEGDYPLAVAAVDLSGFRGVNDSYGSEVGDALLLAVAGRLRHRLRATDLISRPGNDIFLVLMRRAYSLDDLAALADRLLECFEQPFAIGGQHLLIGAAVGIAAYPQDGDSAEALVARAHDALHRAKERPGSCLEFFDLRQGERTGENRRLGSDLQQALAVADQLSVVFLPQVDLRTGAAAGVEALARWRHPTLGQVPPEQLISIAEGSGLIVELGVRLFEITCREVRRWRRHQHLAPRVAFNLSATQFGNELLEQRLLATLRRFRLSPRQFELEVSETAAMENVSVTAGIIYGLERAGFATALDDFGSGYSSLAYLRQLGVDTLKIDRSIVTALDEGEQAREILASMVSLARTLGMRTVAEGIETGAQLATLRRIGCDEGQGFILAMPMSADECGAFLAEHAAPEARVGASRRGRRPAA